MTTLNQSQDFLLIRGERKGTFSMFGCRMRDYAAVLIALSYTTWLTAQEIVAPQPGDVVFQTDFDTPQERAAWSKADFAQWETGYQDTMSLCVTVSPDQSLGGSMIRMPLDLTRFRGHQLLFECMAKAEVVSKPSEPYLGVKFMLHYTSESTGLHWQNQNGVDGTFGWRKLRFVAAIEPDASGGQIDLGLQGSFGKVWLDAIKVTVFKGLPPKRPDPPLNPGPVFKGHDLPRLRGVMSPNTFRDEDLRVLGVDWNANAIRWQITRNWGRAGTDRDLNEYDRWIDSELEDLDKALTAAHHYGLKVVVDMHSPPGGRYENKDLAIFHEPVYQDHYVALWQKIAKRFKGQPAIWGYDLVNEPVQCDPSPPGVADYWGTQVRAAQAIRAIDPEVPIFIEASEWDSASGFRTLEPVEVPRVIYQVHMYVPGEFTHQGVYNKPTSIAYPGEIGDKQWDKSALRKILAPVREFQRAYNVHIYVGEFSAIRWAPGAAEYLSDCIELFEEYDWDWTYHAYREWDGWSVEHGSDSRNHQPTKEPTDRKKLLLSWFARNEKPGALPAVGAEFSRGEDFDANWRSERWVFSNGPEFPGAEGSFERSPQAAHQGKFGGRLAFDFSGGGNYVAATLQLNDAPNLAALRLWIRKPAGNSLTLRYTDQSGQTLQKGFWAPDGRWVDVLVPLTNWTGHWGGDNDGTIHGPPKSIALLVENDGQPRGALLFDELCLLPDTPGDGAATVTSDYLAAGFTPDEQWHLRAKGNAGLSSLRGRRLDFDFSRGADSIGIGPRDFSLLGNPREIRFRVRGSAPGHPVRLQIATHFMTFEKVIGEFDGNETSEIVVPAPPSEGWRWHGGENDGKRHGPLRIRGIYLDSNDRKDSGSLELNEIRVQATCPRNRCCVLMADHRERPDGGAFVAMVRSMAPESLSATLRHTIRDWSGQVIASGSTEVTLPGGGRAVETAVPVPSGEWLLLEAEFVLEAEGQLVPSAEAYYTAPLSKQADNRLKPDSLFGMGLYLYRYGGDAAGLATMDRAAQMGAEAGVKWSREEFSWARIEVAPGKYDWSFYDQVVATAKRHGISVYGLLAYWSPWTKPYTTEGIEDYCRFATAAVTRYRDDIQNWEVYNEPNIFFWQGPRDMYAELLSKAHAAIKEANPMGRVLGCSTAGIDLDFIRRTMELGAPFDVLTIHPYRGRMDDRQFIAELQEAAEVAKKADGARRPVWITEMGWATHVLHNNSTAGFRVTTQRDQACLIARSYIDAIASGVAPNVSWYDFRNDGTDPFNFEHNMGIVTRDFRPKPAYRAYATVATILDGLHVDGELRLGENVFAYRFIGDQGESAVLALWSTLGQQTVKLPATENCTLVDLMGDRTTLEPTDGLISVSLRANTPIFVRIE